MNLFSYGSKKRIGWTKGNDIYNYTGKIGWVKDVDSDERLIGGLAFLLLF
jgi:hypothetical protein